MTAKIDGTNGLIQQYDYQVLTTAFTYTFAAGTTVLVINPAGTLATGTITFPAAPADGMTVTFSSTQQITALTLAGNGKTIVSAVTGMLANQATSYVYRLSNTSWYPLLSGVNSAPAFSAYSTVGTSVADSTFIKLTSNTTRFDTNTNYASSRFTPTVAGYYQINAVIAIASSATGYTQFNFYKNGSSYFGGPATSNVTFGPNAAGSTLISLNGSTDYVEIYAFQNTGLTVTLTIKDFNGFLARSA